MSIDLSRVTGISDSRGVITEIKDSLGRVIWSAVELVVGALYLRPSADISVGHRLYPTDSTAAYLLISEEVADGTATYIDAGNLAGAYTSKFKLSSGEYLGFKSLVVTSVNIIGQVYSPDSTCEQEIYLEINGNKTSIVELNKGKTDMFDLPLQDAISMINDVIAASGSLPDINVSITSHAVTGEKAGDIISGGISQIYVVLGYEGY